jgi:hypothetical protein
MEVETVEQTIRSILYWINFNKKYTIEEIRPEILKGEFKIVYRFDIVSLLSYYKNIFTNAGLERITGINQRQLAHYSSGLKRPRPAQTKKIMNALHELGSELLSIEL